VTWAIVIDWPEERVEKLVDLLADKCLNYIEIIEFNEDEDDDDVDEDFRISMKKTTTSRRGCFVSKAI
jgi:hypothetical protein